MLGVGLWGADLSSNGSFICGAGHDGCSGSLEELLDFSASTYEFSLVMPSCIAQRSTEGIVFWIDSLTASVISCMATPSAALSLKTLLFFTDW